MAKVTDNMTMKLGFIGVVFLLLVTIWAVFFWREDQPAETIPDNPTPTMTLTPSPTPQPTTVEDDLTPTITPSSAETPTPTEESELSPSPSPTAPLEVDTVPMRVYEYTFDPAILRAEAGEHFRIQIENTGNTPHNFVIDELSVDSGEIAAGDTVTVDIEIPINEQNAYVFYSSIDNQRELGMEGRIDVEQN